MLDMIQGMPVVSSPFVGEHKRTQIRYPKTKRKRIRKKWAKNERNFRTRIIPGAYIIDEPSFLGFPPQKKLLIHPTLLQKLKNGIHGIHKTTNRSHSST